jgi:hypothetical protein
VRATAGAERSRALRASRSVHESREWARGVRDRGAGANVELAERRKLHSHFHMLVPKQLHAHPSMVPTAPIMRSRTGAEPITNGCEPHAHLARLRGCATLPLTLFAQWAGTTTADTGSIHDTQAAIDFAPLLLDAQFLVGWTAKGAV